MSILKVGLVASIPALCGFAGGVLGGVFSDYLIKRGFSITVARKLPIVLGMLLASTIILCNYTDNTALVVTLMALAFFGKGFGALGWPVISDTAPKEIVGLCGGVFNVFGNVASIVTPLVIGYGERAALIQRSAGLRRMLSPDGDGLLSVCGRRHQTHGTAEIING